MSSVERLVIEQVSIDRFGGWADRSLTLPDRPLVVVHGPNEAGKSTLAELIAWLLAGPLGSAAEIQRFGAAGDRIGGLLCGRLGLEPFEATGGFRVLKTGAPNDNGLAVRLGRSLDLDAAAWRARLGGVDPQVLAAVYRLWGEQLHLGHGVQDHLSKVALAALGGRIDPHVMARELLDEVKKSTSSRATGVRSMATLRVELAEVDERRRVAATTADHYAVLGQRIDELEFLRGEVHVRLDDLRERRRVVTSVLEIQPMVAEVTRLEGEIGQLGQVPPPWAALADDPGALHDAVVELAESITDCERADPQLASHLADLGIGHEQVVTVTVTDTDLRMVARLTAGLCDADRSRGRAEEREAALRVELGVRRAATDRVLDVTGDVTREQIQVGLLGVEEQASLRTASGRWSEAVEQASRAREVHANAQARLRADLDHLEQMRVAWDRWGLGVTAQQWVRGPSASPPGGADRHAVPWWSAPVVVGAVALVALVLGQPTIALAALVAATVVALLTRPRAASPAEAVDAIADDAAAVLDAERGVAAADLAVGHARSAVDTAHESLGAARASVRELTVAFRLPGSANVDAVTDPATFDARRRVWVAASIALAEEHTAISALDTASAETERRRQEVGEIECELGELVRSLGVCGETHLRDADEVVGRYREAHLWWREVHGAHERLDAARDGYLQLIAPIVDEVDGWSPERVAETADRWHEHHEHRRELQAELHTARSSLEATLRSDAAVRSLVDELCAEPQLRAQLTRLDQDVEAGDGDLRSISEQIGELRHTRSELAAAEELAALAMERGTLREAQEELAVQAVTAAWANRVLRSVADEYERDHQPAIIERTSQLARSVAPSWDGLVVRASESNGFELVVRQAGGRTVAADHLSTGGRALLYLALRVAMADHDAQLRGVSVPLVCDDPLVHLDDRRAAQAMDVLRDAAELGRQVVIFTCLERTVAAAVSAGAGVVRLS